MKPIPSELRNGYAFIEEWIDAGCAERAGTAFTEGDCRLAAQLVEHALSKCAVTTEAERRARRILVSALRERLAYEEGVLAAMEKSLRAHDSK